jgi:hypothetical protein
MNEMSVAKPLTLVKSQWDHELWLFAGRLPPAPYLHTFGALCSKGEFAHPFSFHPEKPVGPIPLRQQKGEVRDESLRDFNRAVAFGIEENGYNAAAEHIEYSRKHPPDYFLFGRSKNAQNCVTFCHAIMRVAGLEVPANTLPVPTREIRRIKSLMKQAQVIFDRDGPEAPNVRIRYYSPSEIRALKQQPSLG